MFCWLVSSLKHSAWWWVWFAGVTSACCPVIFSVNTMITVGFNCRCNKCLLSCHFYDERSMTTVGLNGRKGQVPVVLSFLWWMVNDNSGLEWLEGTGACCPVISMMNGRWQQWVWMAGRDRCLLSCHFCDQHTMMTMGLNYMRDECVLSCHFYDQHIVMTVGLNCRCDECLLSYHFYCLDPPVKKSPKVRGYAWHCEACDPTDLSVSQPSSSGGGGKGVGVWVDLRVRVIMMSLCFYARGIFYVIWMCMLLVDNDLEVDIFWLISVVLCLM